MMPRLVLFDIDGTLIAPKGGGRRSLQRAFEDLYGRPDLVDGVRFAGRMDPQIVSDALIRAGLDDAAAPEVLLRYVQHLEDEMRERPAEILPGVREVLDGLGEREDVTVGLVTGNVREGARLKLKAAGILDDFQVGAFGDEAATRGELVTLARERARRGFGRVFRDEHVFLVGDTENDVKAAHEAGAVSVAVATGDHSTEVLARFGPHHLFASLVPAFSFLRVVLR